MGARPGSPVDLHRLVIVGGGVAGLDMASHLAGKKAGSAVLRVTLVDREVAYIWKPMLHTIAAGTSNAGMQQTMYAAQARSHGFSFQPGEAVGVDVERRRLRLGPLSIDEEEVVPARELPYDTLVIAVGSRANDFGTPGVAEHCAKIDSRTEAIDFNEELRVRLLKAMVSQGTFTVGIVGGGATGVELAAQLVQVAETAEVFANERSVPIKVVLIESSDRILGAFPEKVADAAQAKLEELGVTVLTDAKVASVDEGAFHFVGRDDVPADLKVWAAGVKAPKLLDAFDRFERTRSGQLVVGPTLAVPELPNVYALGDCASPRLMGRQDAVPTTAQAAHQEALYLCRHLPALIAGKPAPDASYHDFGSLVSLGGYDAFGSLGKFGLFGGGFIRGRVAQLGHAMLYRSFQARLHGLWKGGLLWLADMIGQTARKPRGHDR